MWGLQSTEYNYRTFADHHTLGNGTLRGQKRQSTAKRAPHATYHARHAQTLHGSTSTLAQGHDATRSDAITITPVSAAAALTELLSKGEPSC